MVKEYIQTQSYHTEVCDFTLQLKFLIGTLIVTHYNYKKFILNRNKSNSGRITTVRAQQIVAAVGDMLQNNPRGIKKWTWSP